MRKSFPIRTPVAATALLAMVTAATPAMAAPLSPLERCTSGLIPTTDLVLEHPGAVSVGYPNVADQPNIIFPGDVFAIYSSGSVTIDYWGNSYGPGGKSGDFAGNDYPFPGLPKYSSVLRFNNNPTGWIGKPDLTVNWAGCHLWTSSAPVRVGFIVNDNGMGDNSGQWRYHIMHYKP
ncbi:hypothetical protein [Amycolatopsis sp. NPDC003861]